MIHIFFVLSFLPVNGGFNIIQEFPNVSETIQYLKILIQPSVTTGCYYMSISFSLLTFYFLAYTEENMSFGKWLSLQMQNNTPQEKINTSRCIGKRWVVQGGYYMF